MKRYKVTIWHGEGGSVGEVIDTLTGREMEWRSTFKDGITWRELLDIKAEALNSAVSPKQDK